MPAFVALSLDYLELAKAHITLTWLGKVDAEQLKQIIKDLEELIVKIKSMTLKFGSFKVLGKPEDIEAGKGLTTRVCVLEEADLMDIILPFYKKHYFHEAGEDEARKVKPTFHITVNEKAPKEIVEKLDKVKVNSIFVKADGKVVFEHKL